LKVKFTAPYHFLGSSLNELFPQITFDYSEVWEQSDLLRMDLSGFDILVPNPGWRFTLDDKILSQVKGFKDIKLISTPSTGLNHISSSLPVTVVGLRMNPGQLKKITASGEFTVLLALALVRSLPFAIEEVKNKRWRHREDLMRGRELSAMRVGIVGFGRNGQLVARFLNAIGCDIVEYVDPNINDAEHWHATKKDSIEQLDVELLIITCALDNSTINLFNKEVFSKLKSVKYLVNTSRGELIDENALKEWLVEDKNRRYAADTLSGEVKNTHFNSVLLSTEIDQQVIITPHVAGATLDSQIKAAHQAINNALTILVKDRR
jgi:lactate dehydrogenase-like 2-hydroxyacid dehydrogenase